MTKLKWSKLEGRYEYLSKEDSALYDSVVNRPETYAQHIKRLLEDKAAASKAAHCNSTY